MTVLGTPPSPPAEPGRRRSRPSPPAPSATAPPGPPAPERERGAGWPGTLAFEPSAGRPDRVAVQPERVAVQAPREAVQAARARHAACVRGGGGRFTGLARRGGHARPGHATERTWWTGVAGVTVMGFAVRLATVLGRPQRVAVGDASYYHAAANLLVAGHGFIDPWSFARSHQIVQTADWPPLFVFVLGAASALGLKSFFAQRIWCCVVGAAALPLCALTGRTIAGRRVGLLAAGLAALYPNLWMSDELGLSESLSPLLVALVLLAAYRFWRRPRAAGALWLGAATGVAALGRDELMLYVPLIVVPLALMARWGWRRRLVLAGVGTLTACAVVAPWVGYNMSRFTDPTFISSGLGITLASANCPETYAGALEGYWSVTCALRTPVDPGVDQSVQAAEAQSSALRFVGRHEDRLLSVELARIGRAFGAFHPLEQIHLDALIETRPYRWALVGLGSYYLLAALSVGGAVLVRRRGVPILPLVAVGVGVLVAVAVTFGQTRYRTPFEVVVVLLAAVQLDALWRRWTRPRPASVRSGRRCAGAARDPGRSPARPVTVG